jgi:hypothetical protein
MNMTAGDVRRGMDERVQGNAVTLLEIGRHPTNVQGSVCRTSIRAGKTDQPSDLGKGQSFLNGCQQPAGFRGFEAVVQMTAVVGDDDDRQFGVFPSEPADRPETVCRKTRKTEDEGIRAWGLASGRELVFHPVHRDRVFSIAKDFNNRFAIGRVIEYQ